MDNESDKLISTRLRGLSHRIHRFFENSPNKKTIDSITGTHGWIIAFLACNKGKDVFQKDVEREFDVTRSTASKVIDLMEQKGLVTREKVPCDARLKKLVLTQKAQELSELFEIPVIGVSNVGSMPAGTWAGWKAIGNSIAYNSKGQLETVLPYGEDAQCVRVIEVELTDRKRTGTELSEHIYSFFQK